MCRRLTLLLALFALLAPGRALAYGWPLKPFDQEHAIRGFFNDPRREYLPGTLPRTSFHFGIDIAATDGAPIYAVAGGIVDLHASSVSVSGPGDHTFGYWHVDPLVQPGELVAERQLIARVEPGWGHVHFAESVDGVYMNPLRPGALQPYVDTTSPTIASLSIVSRGRPADPTRVRGPVDMLCDAFDTPPLAPPGPWRDTRVTPVLIQWRVVRGEREITRWRTAVDFRFYLLPDAMFDLVYAADTRQNRAKRPGHFSFYLARGWRTDALPNGEYRLEVLVADSWGNTARSALPFTVANGA